MIDQFQSCPFCGGELFEVVTKAVEGGAFVALPDTLAKHHVRCRACGSCGAPAPTYELARSLWNRRSHPTEPEDEDSVKLALLLRRLYLMEWEGGAMLHLNPIVLETEARTPAAFLDELISVKGGRKCQSEP
jgi:hypothetical protein